MFNLVKFVFLWRILSKQQGPRELGSCFPNDNLKHTSVLLHRCPVTPDPVCICVSGMLKFSWKILTAAATEGQQKPLLEAVDVTQDVSDGTKIAFSPGMDGMDTSFWDIFH